MRGPSLGSIYEGSHHLGSILGAPDFWKLRSKNPGDLSMHPCWDQQRYTFKPGARSSLVPTHDKRLWIEARILVWLPGRAILRIPEYKETREDTSMTISLVKAPQILHGRAAESSSEAPLVLT